MKTKIIFLILSLAFIAGLVFYYNTEPITDDIEASDNNQEYSKSDDDKFVYETEVDNADDCTEQEEYDSETRTCFFECSSEAECKEIEQNIEQELAGWLDEETSNKDFQESNDDVNKTLTAEYKVTTGENISLNKGKIGDLDKEIWQHISKIAPNTLSDKYVETFMIFNDSKNDTLAFVDDDDLNGKWRIGINLAGYKSSNTRERNLTIVHELGHIVTLNDSQIKNISETNCKNYFTAEGCTEKSSYLNEFVKNFWGENDIKKALDGGDVYLKNKFVTEYAASGPEEDIAESFAYFVLDNKNENNEIKDKKSSFFYNYSELLDIRENMRQGVYNDIIRSRKLIKTN